MRILARLTSLALLALLLVPGVGRASDSVVGQSDLDRAIGGQLSSDAALRQDVRDVLSRTEVATMAQQMGVDLRQASSAIDTLSGAELARVATQASAVDQALAGGDTTIQISLVAALLIIIILILLLK
jgi:hypothetical protein